jgi:hypothetical protein
MPFRVAKKASRLSSTGMGRSHAVVCGGVYIKTYQGEFIAVLGLLYKSRRFTQQCVMVNQNHTHFIFQ